MTDSRSSRSTPPGPLSKRAELGLRLALATRSRRVCWEAIGTRYEARLGRYTLRLGFDGLEARKNGENAWRDVLGPEDNIDLIHAAHQEYVATVIDRLLEDLGVAS